MIVGESTWEEIRDFDKEAVCLIPTGSLEQHGPHLPLFTDTLLSTGVAHRAHAERPTKSLLYPGIWLGCSSHHMSFAGTATASIATYSAVLTEVIECAMAHGFRKFFVVNGHGGNTEPNGTTLRELKRSYPNHVFAHCGYFSLIAADRLATIMQGPLKTIRHACEAEASMMMYLHPELVREARLRDDQLGMSPAAPSGLNYIQTFDEITEMGSSGYATLATREKGEQLIGLAVEGVVQAIDHIFAGYVMEDVRPA